MMKLSPSLIAILFFFVFNKTFAEERADRWISYVNPSVVGGVAYRTTGDLIKIDVGSEPGCNTSLLDLDKILEFNIGEWKNGLKNAKKKFDPNNLYVFVENREEIFDKWSRKQEGDNGNTVTGMRLIPTETAQKFNVNNNVVRFCVGRSILFVPGNEMKLEKIMLWYDDNCFTKDGFCDVTTSKTENYAWYPEESACEDAMRWMYYGIENDDLYKLENTTRGVCAAQCLR